MSVERSLPGSVKLATWNVARDDRNGSKPPDHAPPIAEPGPG
jgi:hypothetical protein